MSPTRKLGVAILVFDLGAAIICFVTGVLYGCEPVRMTTSEPRQTGPYSYTSEIRTEEYCMLRWSIAAPICIAAGFGLGLVAAPTRK